LGNSSPIGQLEKYRWAYIYMTEVPGGLKRVLVSSRLLTPESIREGLGKLDGSSVKGFAEIAESDLVLKPDLSTLLPYPWCGDLCEDGIARLFADVYKQGGKERHPSDPRWAAQRTEESLAMDGFRVLVGVELEYFIFDSVEVKLQPWEISAKINASQAPWSEDAGHLVRWKEGYYTPSPYDTAERIKYKIIRILEGSYGIKVEVSHHEVAGAGQHEINYQPGGIVESSDRFQLIKEAVKTEAALAGMTATFMPKPVTGDNGSGAHVHLSLWRGNVNMFYDENDPYASISQLARYFIGGIIEHGRALSAIVSPTVNSYKRLVPGLEAPIYLAWSKANRSAAIRIPFYHKKPGSSRIEYRGPDPTMNPYLGLSAIILAGLDGITRKIEPGDPVDENIYLMSPEKRRQLGIRQLPRSLEEALDCLESDHEWLLKAWTKELLEKYMELKRKEARQVAQWVSPAEYYYYADA
jgi:glutamine synthetase